MEEVGTPSTPFDPTKADQQEREKLRKMPWLPPLADAARLKCKHFRKRQPISSSKKKAENLKSKHLDRFPMIEVKESDHIKKTLKTDPNARYLVKLHTESIKDAEQRRLDQERRELVTIQAYDWNLVKKVSQEQQFYRYVEALLKHGRNLVAEMNQEKVPLHIRLRVSDTRESHVSRRKGTKDSLRHDASSESQDIQPDFMEKLNVYMQTSPFRRKLSQVARLKPDQYNYTFGKPEQLKEENEFQRTFTELTTLGSTLTTRSKVLNNETEAFTIPQTIAGVIDSLNGQSKTYSKQAQTQNKSSTPILFHNPTAKTISEYDLDRIALQRDLIRYLQIRKQERLRSTFELKMIDEIEKIATVHLDEYIQNAKGKELKVPPVPNFWMARPRPTQIPGEFKNIGLAQEGLPVIKESRNADRQNNNSKPDATSFKAIMQQFEIQLKLDHIQEIRQMFAQDFGPLAKDRSRRATES